MAVSETRQCITLGTKLRSQWKEPNVEVTVVGMWYYRGINDERDHDLLLEVEFPDGTRFKDVYYHFGPSVESK